MSKITLDLETFKALASTTRLTVLRALDERRKTLTELARDLQLNKATVHEHLELLTKSGLVKKRDDEGRKWIYYELTWTGEKILHPQETTTFNVLLGISVAAAGGGVAMLGRALGWWLQGKAAGSEPAPSDENLGLAAAPESSDSQHQHPSSPSSSADPSGDSAPPATSSAPVRDAGAAADEPFLDGDGWAALALGCAAFLTAGGAVWLRRRLRSKPPGPGTLGP